MELGTKPSLLAVGGCVVCGAEKSKANEATWRGLMGALPLGSNICSEDCFHKAKHRIAIHGRADVAVQGENLTGSTEPDRTPTEPPPANPGDTEHHG